MSDLPVAWEILHVRQQRRVGILGGKRGIREAPVDADRRVVPPNRDFVLRAIERVAFVEEVGRLGENGKTMGEATRNPQLPAILLIQFDSNMSPKIWAADPNIHRNIQNAATERRDQLALREWILQV